MRDIFRALWGALLLGTAGAVGGAVGQDVALAVNNPVVTWTIVFVLLMWQVVTTRWAAHAQQRREGQPRARTTIRPKGSSPQPPPSRAWPRLWSGTPAWPEGDLFQPCQSWSTPGHARPAIRTWPTFHPLWHSFAGLHFGLVAGLCVGSIGPPVGPFLGLVNGMVRGAMLGGFSGRVVQDNPEIGGTTAAAIIGGFLGLICGLLVGVWVLASLDRTGALAPWLFCFIALGAALGAAVGMAINIGPLVRLVIGVGCGAVIGIRGGVLVGMCLPSRGSAWVETCAYIGVGIGGVLGLIAAVVWPDCRRRG
jgi:hypothetical protein